MGQDRLKKEEMYKGKVKEQKGDGVYFSYSQERDGPFTENFLEKTQGKNFISEK